MHTYMQILLYQVQLLAEIPAVSITKNIFKNQIKPCVCVNVCLQVEQAHFF